MAITIEKFREVAKQEFSEYSDFDVWNSIKLSVMFDEELASQIIKMSKLYLQRMNIDKSQKVVIDLSTFKKHHYYNSIDSIFFGNRNEKEEVLDKVMLTFWLDYNKQKYNYASYIDSVFKAMKAHDVEFFKIIPGELVGEIMILRFKKADYPSIDIELSRVLEKINMEQLIIESHKLTHHPANKFVKIAYQPDPNEHELRIKIENDISSISFDCRFVERSRMNVYSILNFIQGKSFARMPELMVNVKFLPAFNTYIYINTSYFKKDAQALLEAIRFFKERYQLFKSIVPKSEKALELMKIIFPFVQEDHIFSTPQSISELPDILDEIITKKLFLAYELEKLRCNQP